MFDWFGWRCDCSALVQTPGGRKTRDFGMRCTWQTAAVLNVSAVR